MNNEYELKIQNAQEETGLIDFKRLSIISSSMLKIAEGALQIRLRGVSFTRGRKKFNFESAIKVYLKQVLEEENTIRIASEPFSQCLRNFQLDMFQGSAQDKWLNATPVSLFADTLREAMDKGAESEWLDKPLLKELGKLNRAFQVENEVFILSNQGSMPDLYLEKENFKRFKSIAETIPGPQSVVLTGKVEELKYSKLKVGIKTKEGIVNGFLSGEATTDKIAQFWGREVTVTGVAHYKPGGKFVMEIQKIFEPGNSDDYFSRKPVGESLEEQINRQIRSKGIQNKLGEIAGKFSIEEDIDTLLEALKS